MTFESQLVTLRPRLLSYCKQLVGEPFAAEDLVQETFLVALQQQRAGKAVADWPSWLAGIARTLAKNRQRRVLSRREDALEETQLSDESPLDSLLLAERGALLERAFVSLDAPTRTLLTQRFLEELPVSELAERLGVSANAASLRILRAREALERVLTTHLRADALAHGLIPTESADGWVDSPLICPRCARNHLQGRLTSTELALRCPECDRPGRGLQGLSTQAAPMPREQILAGAKGFRVAQKRVNGWWSDYIREGLARRSARCPSCSRPAPVATRAGESIGFSVLCERCQLSFFVAPQGLLFHDPQFQAFWREHPRLVTHAPQPLRYQGRDALLVSFGDRQGTARLEALYAADDLTRLDAPNPRD